MKMFQHQRTEYIQNKKTVLRFLASSSSAAFTVRREKALSFG